MKRFIKVSAWIIGFVVFYAISVLLLPLSIVVVAIILAAEFKNKLTTPKNNDKPPYQVEGDCGKNSKN